MYANVLSAVLLSLGALFATFNALGILQVAQRRRRGERRNFSLMPFGFVFVLGAAAIAAWDGFSWLPAWAFGLVALADIATWAFAFLPIHLLRERLRSR